MIEKIGLILIFLLNITWGAIQSCLGFFIFLFFIKKPHFWYKSSVVTVNAALKSTKIEGGLSLGLFIFITYDMEREHIAKSSLIKHEYGHTLQSSFLGPLFLPVIGLPSIIWAGCFAGWRRKHNKDYYSFYTESWADKLTKRLKIEI